MELAAFFKSSRVPDCIYKHLLSSKHVDSASGLTNVLALCKSMCMEDEPSQNGNYYVELAVSNLKDYVSAENVLQETGMKDCSCCLTSLITSKIFLTTLL